MNAGRRGFPATRWSLVVRAGGESTLASRKAMDELWRAYQDPLRDFARRLCPDPDRLNDLLQGFFLHLLEHNRLGAADSTRGQFRSFLRTALRNYAKNVYDAETAQKRGGGAHYIDMDPDQLSSGAPASDQLYDKEWAHTVIKRALAQLGDEQARNGKAALFEALRQKLADEDGTPYREVAAALGMNEGSVRVALHRLVRRAADFIRAEVAETVARPDDVDVELRELRAALRCEE